MIMALYDNDEPKDLKHQDELDKEKSADKSRKKDGELKWTLEGAGGPLPNTDRKELKRLWDDAMGKNGSKPMSLARFNEISAAMGDYHYSLEDGGKTLQVKPDVCFEISRYGVLSDDIFADHKRPNVAISEKDMYPTKDERISRFNAGRDSHIDHSNFVLSHDLPQSVLTKDLFEINQSRVNRAVSSLGEFDSIADRAIDASNLIMFDGRRPSKDPHEIQPIDDFPSKGRNVDLGADFDGDLPKKDDGDKGLGE